MHFFVVSQWLERLVLWWLNSSKIFEIFCCKLLRAIIHINVRKRLNNLVGVFSSVMEEQFKQIKRSEYLLSTRSYIHCFLNEWVSHKECSYTYMLELEILSPSPYVLTTDVTCGQIKAQEITYAMNLRTEIFLSHFNI
jgi:hypothetical protein